MLLSRRGSFVCEVEFHQKFGVLSLVVWAGEIVVAAILNFVVLMVIRVE